MSDQSKNDLWISIGVDDSKIPADISKAEAKARKGGQSVASALNQGMNSAIATDLFKNFQKSLEGVTNQGAFMKKSTQEIRAGMDSIRSAALPAADALNTLKQYIGMIGKDNISERTLKLIKQEMQYLETQANKTAQALNAATNAGNVGSVKKAPTQATPPPESMGQKTDDNASRTIAYSQALERLAESVSIANTSIRTMRDNLTIVADTLENCRKATYMYNSALRTMNETSMLSGKVGTNTTAINALVGDVQRLNQALGASSTNTNKAASSQSTLQDAMARTSQATQLMLMGLDRVKAAGPQLSQGFKTNEIIRGWTQLGAVVNNASSDVVKDAQALGNIMGSLSKTSMGTGLSTAGNSLLTTYREMAGLQDQVTSSTNRTVQAATRLPSVFNQAASASQQINQTSAMLPSVFNQATSAAAGLNSSLSGTTSTMSTIASTGTSAMQSVATATNAATSAINNMSQASATVRPANVDANGVVQNVDTMGNLIRSMNGELATMTTQVNKAFGDLKLFMGELRGGFGSEDQTVFDGINRDVLKLNQDLSGLLSRINVVKQATSTMSGSQIGSGTTSSLNQMQSQVEKNLRNITRLQSSLNTLGRGNSVISFFSKLSNSLGVNEVQFKKLTEAVGNFKQAALDGVGYILKWVVMGTIFRQGLSALNSLITGVIRFSAEAENARASFQAIFKSEDVANSMSRSLEMIAAKTNLTSTETYKAARLMSMYGFSVQETTTMMKSLADVTAAAGSTEALLPIARALGQIRTKGKVAAQEMIQLTEVGIPAFEILEEKLGLTKKELGNIGKQGISSGQAINALMEGIQERYSGAAELMANTMKGMTDTIRDNISMLLSESIAPVWDGIKSWLKPMRDFLNQMVELSNGYGIGAVLNEIFSPRTTNAMIYLIEGLKLLGQAFSALFSALAPIRDEMGYLTLVLLNMIVSALTPVVQIMATMVGVITQNEWAVRALVAALFGLLVFKTINAFFSGFVFIGKLAAKVVMAVVQVVVLASGGFTMLTGAMAGASISAMGVVGAIAAILAVLAALYFFLGGSGSPFDGLFDDLKRFDTKIPETETNMGDLGDSLKDVGESADDAGKNTDKAGNSADKAGKKAKKAKDYLQSFDEVFRIIADTADNASGKLDEAGKGLDNLGKGNGAGALDDMLGSGMKIPSIDQGLNGDIGKKVDKLLQDIKKKLQDFLKWFTDWFLLLSLLIGGWLSGLWAFIWGFLGPIIANIMNALKTLLGLLGGWFKSALDAVAAFGRALLAWLENLVELIAEMGLAAVAALAGLPQAFIDALVKLIASGAIALKEALKKLIELLKKLILGFGPGLAAAWATLLNSSFAKGMQTLFTTAKRKIDQFCTSFPKWLRGIDGAFNEAAKGAVIGFGAGLAGLGKSAWDKLKGVDKRVGQWSKQFGNNLKDWTKKAIDNGMQGLNGITTAIKQTFKKLGDKIQDFMSPVTDKLEEWGLSWGDIGFAAVSALILGLAGYIFGVPAAIAGALGTAWVTVSGWVSAAWAGIASTGVGSFLTSCGTALKGLGVAIGGLFSKGWLSNVFGAEIDSVDKKEKEQKNKSKSTWSDIKKNMSDSISGAAKTVGDKAKEIANNTGKWFGDVKNNACKKAQDGFKNVKDWAGDMKEKAGDKINSFKEKAKEHFKDLKDKGTTRVRDLKEKVVDYSQDIKKKAGDRFSSFRDKVKDTLKNAYDRGKSSMANLKEKIGDYAKHVKDTSGGRFNSFKDKVKSALSSAYTGGKHSIGSLKDRIGDYASTIRSTYGARFYSFRDKVKSALSSAYTGGSNSIRKLRDNTSTWTSNMRTAWGNLSEKVRGVAGTIAEKIRGIFSGTSSHVDNVFSKIRSFKFPSITQEVNLVYNSGELPDPGAAMATFQADGLSELSSITGGIASNNASIKPSTSKGPGDSELVKLAREMLRIMSTERITESGANNTGTPAAAIYAGTVIADERSLAKLNYMLKQVDKQEGHRGGRIR